MDFIKLLGLTLSEVVDREFFKKEPSIEEEVFEGEVFLGSEKLGIALTFSGEEKILYQIDYYSEGYEGRNEFKGKLPYDLNFSLGKEEINKLLGKPTEFAKLKEIPILGKMPPADSYEFSSHRLVILYSDELKDVLLVTLTTKN